MYKRGYYTSVSVYLDSCEINNKEVTIMVYIVLKERGRVKDHFLMFGSGEVSV